MQICDNGNFSFSGKEIVPQNLCEGELCLFYDRVEYIGNLFKNVTLIWICFEFLKSCIKQT